MRPPEAVLDAKVPLGEAAVLMLAQGLQLVLVEENGRYMGQLTRSDLLELTLLASRDRRAA